MNYKHKQMYNTHKSIKNINEVVVQYGGKFELLTVPDAVIIKDVENISECLKAAGYNILYDDMQLIGKGAFAYVYYNEENNFVIRIEKFVSEERKRKWKETSNYQHSFAQVGQAPSILKTIECDTKKCMNKDDNCEYGYGIQIMTKLKTSLAQLIKNGDDISKYVPRMIKVLTTIMENNYEHCDWHANNWMINENDEIFIIDFGNFTSWDELNKNKEVIASTCLYPSVRDAYSIYKNVHGSEAEQMWSNFLDKYFDNFFRKLGTTINEKCINIIRLIVNKQITKRRLGALPNKERRRIIALFDKETMKIYGHFKDLKKYGISQVFAKIYEEINGLKVL